MGVATGQHGGCVIGFHDGRPKAPSDRATSGLTRISKSVTLQRSSRCAFDKCRRAGTRPAVRGRGGNALPRPGQNGLVETFNDHLRNELLKETLFFGHAHARVGITTWTEVCNRERLHSSPGYKTPAAFAAELDLKWPASLRMPLPHPPPRKDQCRIMPRLILESPLSAETGLTSQRVANSTGDLCIIHRVGNLLAVDKNARRAGNLHPLMPVQTSRQDHVHK